MSKIDIQKAMNFKDKAPTCRTCHFWSGVDYSGNSTNSGCVCKLNPAYNFKTNENSVCDHHFYKESK